MLIKKVISQKLLVLAVVLVSAVFVGLSPLVLSQQQEGGSGLSISPTRTELVVEPNEVDIVNVTVRNVSGIPILVQAVINDFESDNETGEPRLITDAPEPSPASIENFLANLEDFELDVDESRTFDIAVQVPDNMPSGAYYGAIRYTATPLDDNRDDGQVALNASVGTLVLIEVPGDITHQIQLEKISAVRQGRSSSFFMNPPDQAAVTIKNSGNSFAKPFGRVTVSDIRGQEIYSYELNDTVPRSNILPDSSRTFTDSVENIGNLGRYTVTANISHATGSDVLTIKTSFWVLPWWFLAIVAIVLAVVVYLSVRLYRRISHRQRRHKR